MVECCVLGFVVGGLGVGGCMVLEVDFLGGCCIGIVVVEVVEYILVVGCVLVVGVGIDVDGG